MTDDADSPPPKSRINCFTGTMNRIQRRALSFLLLGSLLTARTEAFATLPHRDGHAPAFGITSRSAASRVTSQPLHLSLHAASVTSSWRHKKKTSCAAVTRDRRTVLFMGWGPEPVWSDAKIESVDKACESGASAVVRVQVPAETFQQYQVPGQYVQIRLDDDTKPLFLAMASPPPSSDDENAPSNGSTFEFLVKKTPTNDWITNAASAGAAIQVSQVLGSGFPMADNLEGFKYDFPTQNVLLFAAGSGIGPIKAAMESGQLQVGGPGGGGGRTARLYYGERTASDLCFVDQFTTWEAMGYEVVPVLSQPDDAWKGRAGYVQNALEEDGVAIPRNSGALVVGMKGMAEAVKALLLSAGVFDGRVLFNF